MIFLADFWYECLNLRYIEIFISNQDQFRGLLQDKIGFRITYLYRYTYYQFLSNDLQALSLIFPSLWCLYFNFCHSRVFFNITFLANQVRTYHFFFFFLFKKGNLRQFLGNERFLSLWFVFATLSRKMFKMISLVLCGDYSIISRSGREIFEEKSNKYLHNVYYEPKKKSAKKFASNID